MSLLRNLSSRNLIRRMSSAVHRLIIADPAAVKSPEDYQVTVTEGREGRGTSFDPGTFVRVPVSETLFKAIQNGRSRSHLKYCSAARDESFWHFGTTEAEAIDIAAFQYIGSHGSDSGLTAIIEENPFTTGNVKAVDWPEFVLTTLDQREASEGTPEELEEYGLFKFYGQIPDDSDQAAAVYAKGDPKAYDSIIIRSLDAAMSSDEDQYNGQ